MTNPISIDVAREARAVAEIRELLALEESAPQRAIRLGELFTECKEAVGHGHWLPWLKAHGFYPQQASRYMQAYRGSKLHTVSNLPPPKTIKEAQSRAPRKPKESFGWISAMQRFSGLSMQFGGSQAKTISKALGYDVTKRSFTEQEARDMAAQAALCFAEPPPRETLNKTEEKLVARAIRQELAKLRKEAAQALNDAVNERMKPILKDYGDAIDAARKEKEDYENYAKDIYDWMSYEDYQVVISCLHPDRAPAGMEEKYRRAFQVMNALKKRFPK